MDLTRYFGLSDLIKAISWPAIIEPSIAACTKAAAFFKHDKSILSVGFSRPSQTLRATPAAPRTSSAVTSLALGKRTNTQRLPAAPRNVIDELFLSPKSDFQVFASGASLGRLIFAPIGTRIACNSLRRAAAEFTSFVRMLFLIIYYIEV